MFITVSSNVLLVALVIYSLYRAIVSFGDFFSVKKSLENYAGFEDYYIPKVKLQFRLRTVRKNAIIYSTSFLVLSSVLLSIYL